MKELLLAMVTAQLFTMCRLRENSAKQAMWTQEIEKLENAAIVAGAKIYIQKGVDDGQS